MCRPLSWLFASVLFASSFAPSVLAAQTPSGAAGAARQGDALPAWEAELKRRHEELIQTNGPGTDAALRTRLLNMVVQDQEARGFKDGTPKDKKNLQVATNLNEIDAVLTEQLKDIVAKQGWPTIALVGIEASNAAMLILTHSRDHAWQLSLLPQLEQLADSGKIDGSSLALVIDKELVSEGKLQRYGSQFKLITGGMAMYAVEDPGGLDARRSRVFLPPMDVYKKTLEEIYHLKATNQIVMATPPAKPAEAK